MLPVRIKETQCKTLLRRKDIPGLYWYAPTTSNCSKESSVKEREITEAAQNLKEDSKTSSASVNSVNMGSNVISISVVLVKVGYEGTDKVFRTYALFENCS